MQRVPRKWAEWTVKQVQQRRSTMTLAVIYIGADVVTFASLIIAGGPKRAREKTSTEGKKRLGSRRHTPCLTQSLTLSHVNKILHARNSSADLVIILPAALFSRIKLVAPPTLSPTDLAPTLRWAIQQQGFSPLQDWFWDAVSHPPSSTEEAYWEAFLLPAATANSYLQRLGVQQSRVARLVPDDQISSSEVDLPMGPWLENLQVQLCLGYLQQYAEGSLADAVNRSGSRQLQPRYVTPTVNLACNLVTRTNRIYYRAFVQCSGMVSAILVTLAVWWMQQAAPITSSHPTADSASTAVVTPFQPLIQHIHLWQALYALNDKDVRIQHLEYLRGRWLLQIATLNPNSAGDWIQRLDEELNKRRQNRDFDATLLPWRVLTSASRSRQGSTIFDVEIVQ